MFKQRQKNKLSVKVKGLGNVLSLIISPIKYEVRVFDGNWSPYFGKYQNQKWGDWDSDSCWCLSSINSAEDQIEYLWKNGMFGQEAKDFFTKNGYIDSDGDFSLSERFHEILCGNLDNGGTPEEAWQSFAKRGFIPRSMLTYTHERAKTFKSKSLFNLDYFNTSLITPAMLALGKESLKHINVAYQRIGTLWTTPDMMILQAAVKQAPLNLGIPIPYDNLGNCLWNSTYIKYNGGTIMQHEVECYSLTNGMYFIFDQYMPNLKELSPDYYIPKVTQGIITAVKPASVNTVPQPTGAMDNKFWTGVFNWFNNIFTTDINVG